MCDSDATVINNLLQQITLLEAATYRSQAITRLNKTRATLALIVKRTALEIEAETLSPVISARAFSFIASVKTIIDLDAKFLADLAWKAAGATGIAPSSLIRNFVIGQESFLNRWEVEIKRTGKLVGGQTRAAMYVDRLFGFYQEVYGAATATVKGVPALPAYPKDGTTQCLTNCKCKWRLEYVKGRFGAITEVRAFWVLSPVENCPTCLCRATRWNPLTFIRLPNGTWEQRESGAAQCALYRQ